MLSLLATLAIAAEPIGSFGATLDLPREWVRSRVDLASGPDQFHTAKGSYLVVVEIRNPMLEESDVTRAMERFAAGVEAKSGVEVDPPRVTRRAGRLEGETRWTATTKGVRVAFEAHLVGKDGLAYLLLTWSQAGQRVRLGREARRIADSLTLPGPQGAWADRRTPTAHTAELSGWKVSYAAPAAFLEPKEDKGDAFVALGNVDGSIAVYFLVEHNTNADAVLNFALGRLNGGEAPADAQRSVMTIDGKAASLATFAGPDRGEPTFGMVAAIPFGDGEWMDVRMIGLGTPAAHQALWEGVLASIDIEPLPVLDPFPTTTAAKPERTLTDAQRALLEAGTPYGAFYGGRGISRGKTRVYSQSYRAVQVLSLSDGAITQIPIDHATGAAAEQGDALYVPLGDAVKKVVGDAITDAGFTATKVADAGERGLLLVRAPQQVKVAGYSSLEVSTGPSIVLRSPDGQERTVTTLPGREVSAVAVHGDDVLLLTSDPDDAWKASELEFVALSDGKRRALGAWADISALVSGPDGWMVTGTPVGAPAGIWALSLLGERTLVLSGRHGAGVPLEGGDLLLVSEWHPPNPDLQDWQTAATRVPAAALAAHGAAFDPLTPADLGRLASGALASLNWSADPGKAFADAASIRRFVAAADKAAVARLGVGLPADAAAVDRLLAEAHGDPAVDEPADLLFVALLADTMIRDGATWVPGRAPVGGVAGDDTFQNDHAIGWLPRELVRSTLHDEEGWWDPAVLTASAREGRASFIGLDPVAVRTRVEAARRTGIEALDAAPAAAVISWLQLEPKNEHLRNTVYRRLAAVGRAAELPGIAAPFLADKAWADTLADLVGRGAAKADATALIADVRAALATHTDEPGLYVLLAETYERAGDPKLAEAAWRHLLVEYKWSDHAEDARAAIVRLGGTPPEE